MAQWAQDMNKYIFTYLFIMILGCCKSPIVIDTVTNNCIKPPDIEYFHFNNAEYNQKIDELTKQWPEDLKSYLHLKLQNRIIQHERCLSHVEEHKSYENCILSLIDQNSYDEINR